MRVVCRSALYSAWGRAIVRLRGLPGGDFALETQANEGAVSHRLTGPVASTRKRGLKLIAGDVYAPMGAVLRLARQVRLNQPRRPFAAGVRRASSGRTA
jgi:hypothetical protein